MLLRHEGFRRLCHARDLLRDAREPTPTIEQLAREVRISPFHFIRQFEAVFGVTPHQFRIASRIELAKALLAGGDYSVTDVCMEVGFSSLGQFQHAVRAACRRNADGLPATHQDPGVSARTPRHSPHAWMLEPDGNAAPRAKRVVSALRRTIRPAEAGHYEPSQFSRSREPSNSADWKGGATRTRPTHMRIKLTSLMVDDQSKALRFYTEVLGFTKRHDIPVGEYRWITVTGDRRDDLELALEPTANPAGKAFQEAMFAQGIRSRRSRSATFRPSSPASPHTASRSRASPRLQDR